MEDTYLFITIGIVVLIVIILLMLKKSAPLPYPNTNLGEVVSKDLYNSVLAQSEMLKIALQDKEKELLSLSSKIAAKDQQILHFEAAISTQKGEMEKIHHQLLGQFEQLANRILEEKGKVMNEQQSLSLHHILQPLQEKIRSFQADIDQKFLEETREKAGLKKEIETMNSLNRQLSIEANNLASALKGQNKIQGNWGEVQLEMILEKSGLTRGVHYEPQNTFRDDDGRMKRPDFVVLLPENKHLIIDAKVSLTDYERFYNEADPEKQAIHLKAHINSLRRHVEQLSSKSYQMLHQVNSPDYLLLYIPLDSAYNTAAQADPRLFTDALERNILIVTTGSLVATMRTIAHVWKQEKQTKSVLEIARQSGLLYDKFVNFVEDLRTIGARLDGAQNAYQEAMNKLVNSPKYGDTLVGRAEKIRELGARSSKSLPKEILESLEEE